MAAKQTGRVVLLAITPEHAKGILEGRKKVEFRRTLPAKPVEWVVLYATKPEQKVVGYFRVGKVETGTARELWARHNGHGGLNEAAFMAYFDGAPRGVAITVKDAYVLANPVGLAAIGKSTTPPQSFLYLENGQWARVRRRKARPVKPNQGVEGSA